MKLITTTTTTAVVGLALFSAVVSATKSVSKIKTNFVVKKKITFPRPSPPTAECQIASDCGDGLVVCVNGSCETFCGGFAGFQCPEPDQECVDVPDDGCDPAMGGADCGGFCQDSSSSSCTDCEGSDQICIDGTCEQLCGTIQGLTCDANEECVDIPDDGCEPPTGSDCAGICQERAVSCPDRSTSNYFSFDYDFCIRARFEACPDGQNFFSQEGCGCGCTPQLCAGFLGETCPSGSKCIDIPSDSCDPRDGGSDCQGVCLPKSCPSGRRTRYVSVSPSQCQVIRFSCFQGEEFLTNTECGCGCTRVKGCPVQSPGSGVVYSSSSFPCPVRGPPCRIGQQFFQSPCGCGCKATRSWRRLVGKDCGFAKKFLEKNFPELNQVVCIPEGSPVTLDIRFDRVRLFHDDMFRVVSVPMVG